MRFDNVKQTWESDIAELSLFCEEALVGTCRFDLANYVD